MIMESAVREAINGMNSNEGGPFGAVVVKDGMIIAVGHNEVIKTNDITNHAEIVAIRKACQELGTRDLSGCQIYASCHPCPMCLGACLFAKIDGIYYAADLKEAAEVGFDSIKMYKFWEKYEHPTTKIEQVTVKNYLKPFEYWKNSGKIY